MLTSRIFFKIIKIGFLININVKDKIYPNIDC